VIVESKSSIKFFNIAADCSKEVKSGRGASGSTFEINYERLSI